MPRRGDLSGSFRDRLPRSVLAVGAVAMAGVMAGLAVVDTPWMAWAMLGASATAVLLLAPARIRIGAVVLAATCSRLFVATGLVTSAADFFHYPLALGAALVAAVEGGSSSSARRWIEVGVLGLLGVALVSWVFSGGQLVRPLLDWLVFVEPFLVIYAVLSARGGPRETAPLWALALGIPLVQVPIAIYQAVSFGLSDVVRGYFVGMGSGAHVAGAVSLVGALVSIARALVAERGRQRAAWLTGGILMFLVAILSDAKQVIIIFFAALVVLLFHSVRMRLSRTILVFPALAAVVLGAFSYYRPLQIALDWSLISRGVLGKALAFTAVAQKFSGRPARWIFGLGPGNSISRVALMGLEAFVKRDSPVFLLGLSPAATTRELYAMSTSNRLFSASSVWTGVSSWLGLLGDMGLAGLAFFVAACAGVWANLGRRSGWEAGAAQAVLLMYVLLGLLYSWLEEPGFTLMAALVVGLGSVAGDPRDDQAPLAGEDP